MKFNISVVSADITTKPTAKGGSYQMLTLAYKDETSGKLSEKKFMSFTNKPVFELLADAKQGQRFAVVAEKGEKYWEWTQVQRISGDAPPAASSGSAAPAGGGGRTFETAEERALRQVLIVRQSSLSAAVSTLTTGAKSTPKVDDVLNLAEVYYKWVFEQETKANNVFTPDELKDIEDVV